MAMTYEELHKKTVAELRDIAKSLDHEAVQGYTQMNKDHLLPAVCKALEAHDSKKLTLLRREMHTLNHRLRAHTV
jgi:hypothetical protein